MVFKEFELLGIHGKIEFEEKTFKEASDIYDVENVDGTLTILKFDLLGDGWVFIFLEMKLILIKEGIQ